MKDIVIIEKNESLCKLINSNLSDVKSISKLFKVIDNDNESISNTTLT